MFLSDRNNLSFDLFNSSNKNYQLTELKGDIRKKNDIDKDDYTFILLYAEPIEINEEEKNIFHFLKTIKKINPNFQ